MKRLYIKLTQEIDLIPYKKIISDTLNGAELGRTYKWLFISIVYRNGK